MAADAETFAQAAARRRVTKSAISQQIKSLEGQLGVPLFERVGRYARLTDAGRTLADVLRRELEVIDDALDALVASQRGVEGPIAIGAPRPFARYWLRKRTGDLLARHPGLRLTVLFGTPTELEALLAARRLDLAILVREPSSLALATTRIFVERFQAYGSPAYLREHGTPRAPADFAAHRFVVYDDDLPMHAAWWRAVAGRKAAPPGVVVCKVASLDEILALAARGIGIAVLPEYFAADAVRDGEVVPLRAELRRGAAQNDILLAWRKGVVTTSRFTAVRDALTAKGDAP